jgi:hypothetical protein
VLWAAFLRCVERIPGYGSRRPSLHRNKLLIPVVGTAGLGNPPPPEEKLLQLRQLPQLDSMSFSHPCCCCCRTSSSCKKLLLLLDRFAREEAAPPAAAADHDDDASLSRILLVDDGPHHVVFLAGKLLE